MSKKKWAVLPDAPKEFYAVHPELPPIIARLLYNRGLKTQEQIDEFLNPDYSEDIHDPYLFNDMAKAVDIIFEAINQQKNITVHGDYDADGVCAAAILINCLKKLGAKNVGVFLPHREIDGYGLNIRTVKMLAEQKTDLLITCDCGISNHDEMAAAKAAGLQIIITDHHAVPAIPPPADAIIHPKMPNEKYPDKGLCGGAVAFKLAQGLLMRHKKTSPLLPDGQTHEGFEKWLLDLVALSLVGDMMPMRGEARTLTRYGLTVLNKTRNLGLQQLLIAAGLADENGRPKRGVYDTFSIGWQIVPRLNAAGRMDHANTAFALLMADNVDEAKKLALQLNKNNSDRQRLTEQIVTQAKQQIKDTKQEKNSVIFAYGPEWATGILGLVAGKLREEFGRPALAMGLSKEKEIVGSGRSIPEFNLIAAIQTMPEFFLKFGGHPQACGFSIKDEKMLEKFKKSLIKKAEKELDGADLSPRLMVDAEVSLEDVDWKLFDLLQKFEPFGPENEEPSYAAYGLTVTGISPVGQDGKHLRLLLKHNSHIVRKTIGFGLGDPARHPDDWRNTLKVGDKIDMVFSIGVNEWNGNRELELSIEDIRRHGA